PAQVPVQVPTTQVPPLELLPSVLPEPLRPLRCWSVTIHLKRLRFQQPRRMPPVYSRLLTPQRYRWLHLHRLLRIPEQQWQQPYAPAPAAPAPPAVRLLLPPSVDLRVLPPPLVLPPRAVRLQVHLISRPGYHSGASERCY